MAREWLESDDVSVYVIGGVSRSFEKALKKLLKSEGGEEAGLLRLEGELEEWAVARVRGEYRTSTKRSPASKALWRAFRALAAARYHLRTDPTMDEKLRSLRDQVEALWLEASPMHRQQEE